MGAGSIRPSEGKRIPGSIKSFMLLGKLGLGAAHSDIVCQTSGYALGICEGRVGCAQAMEPEDLFIVMIVLSFVSMMFSCGRKEGICVEEGRPA